MPDMELQVLAASREPACGEVTARTAPLMRQLKREPGGREHRAEKISTGLQDAYRISCVRHQLILPDRSPYWEAANPIVFSSSRIADLDWQQGRVYFLAFLNPQGDNRSLPLPPGWPVSATVDEPATELD